MLQSMPQISLWSLIVVYEMIPMLLGQGGKEGGMGDSQAIEEGGKTADGEPIRRHRVGMENIMKGKDPGGYQSIDVSQDHGISDKPDQSHPHLPRPHHF